MLCALGITSIQDFMYTDTPTDIPSFSSYHPPETMNIHTYNPCIQTYPDGVR